MKTVSESRERGETRGGRVFQEGCGQKRRRREGRTEDCMFLEGAFVDVCVRIGGGGGAENDAFLFFYDSYGFHKPRSLT